MTITFRTSHLGSTFTGTVIRENKHTVFVKPDDIIRKDGTVMEMVPMMIDKTCIVE